MGAPLETEISALSEGRANRRLPSPIRERLVCGDNDVKLHGTSHNSHYVHDQQRLGAEFRQPRRTRCQR